eukprot:TRINITY_DN6706_c0_g1_i2.p1 TRINITY_DN6706_c0_g1~~TRINITY_DN6706_c0_g1_i2.p1  ORF type:complete len:484 (+),score=119.67 TRINITY_DN6706_c0_g1_i2:240-1691(+)
MVKKIPSVKQKITDEKEKIRVSFVEEMTGACKELQEILALPEVSSDNEAVLAKVNQYLGVGGMDWKAGAMSGTVYNCSQQGLQLISDVYGLTSLTNPLHPDAFPGIRQMEMEVVRMTCDMFNGGPETVGCVTTGGTESIILACKSYRDMAIERGVKYPEILCPVSAHAAFDKAADMLGISIRHVPLDPDTMRVDTAAMQRMINKNTMMLVGSAPQFPHGSVDPIEAIAKLGVRYNLPVHVDACLGGFLVPFMKSAGYDVPPFDFSVPGVCSISADTHKYGYAPKGTSVLMYKNAELRSYQWFSFPDWPGGIYATPTIGGSRSGGIIAACWATMISYGKEGYVKATKEIVATTRKIASEIATVPTLKIVGKPDVSVVAFTSDKFNVYSLSDALKARGWALNALQFPECVHLCVTRLHTEAGVADKFVRDVREATEIILRDPEAAGGGSAAVYGMAASIPDRSIVSELTAVYLDSLYASKADISR